MNNDEVMDFDDLSKHQRKNPSRQFSFMTNILAEPKHKTTFVKWLAKFTIDGQVSFFRLLVAVVMAALLIISFLYYILGDFLRTRYTFIPALLIMLGSFIILFNYIVSSRQKSLLSSTTDLMLSILVEKNRRNNFIKAKLKTLGIKKVTNKGILIFDDGDVGFAYKVNGHLSRSVLPSVAMSVAEKKRNYLIDRTPTSKEIMITSVQTVNVDTQLKNLKKQYDKAHYYMTNYDLVGEDEAKFAWIKFMTSKTAEYIKENMEGREYTIDQVIIIKDMELETLKKSLMKFSENASNGLYSSVFPLSNKNLVVDALAPISLISKKGKEKEYYVEEEKFSKNERLYK